GNATLRVYRMRELIDKAKLFHRIRHYNPIINYLLLFAPFYPYFTPTSPFLQVFFEKNLIFF
ncbi:MAG: hypothetical protein MR727_03585, partial [Lentisphaeria bacterium]|nr:hypothetical protein [Lentisphaeria bacterium]